MATHQSRIRVNARQLEEDETVPTHSGPISASKDSWVVSPLTEKDNEKGEKEWVPDGTVLIFEDDDFRSRYDSLGDEKETAKDSNGEKKATPNDIPDKSDTVGNAAGKK